MRFFLSRKDCTDKELDILKIPGEIDLYIHEFVASLCKRASVVYMLKYSIERLKQKLLSHAFVIPLICKIDFSKAYYVLRNISMLGFCVIEK